MVDRTLRKLYFSLDQPSALSKVDRLHKHARKFYPTITRQKVEEWLQGQDSYTLYKPARRKLRAAPRVFVKHIDDQWGVDLCDMQDVARSNDNVRYMLTCIDIFTKYAWAVPVSRKNGPTVTDAFRSILNLTARRPKKIESANGKEFYNQHFKQLLHQNKIQHFSSHSRHKCAVIERFNRTLKMLIYRSFEARNSLRWLNVLDDLLVVYNKRYHRSIKMAPRDVNNANERKVFSNLYRKLSVQGKLLDEGQLVRISKIKKIFEKGYLPNYTEEVFRISKVYRRKPYQYELKDLMGEVVEGKFVAEELAVVRKSDETIWRIEKVLKRDKKGRYLVKWFGFPSKFNSYVDTIEFVQ